MKRRVKHVAVINAVQAPPHITGETTLGVKDKQPGIEMWTGIEPGYVTVFYKNAEIGVPMANVRSLIWEKPCITDVAQPEQSPDKPGPSSPQPLASGSHSPGNIQSANPEAAPPGPGSSAGSALP